ncbi:hypothetical protein CH370_17875 [Leptospira kmetyi]|nr:hypothetical protein CH370_17875 [Leptospira kmetyi]
MHFATSVETKKNLKTNSRKNVSESKNSRSTSRHFRSASSIRSQILAHYDSIDFKITDDSY